MYHFDHKGLVLFYDNDCKEKQYNSTRINRIVKKCLLIVIKN